MKTKLKFSEKIVYYFLNIWVRMIGLLPYTLLYIKSSACFYLLYYLIGYRKKVVRKNLVNSFPSKSESEIISIEKEFYRHLCDWFFETMKLSTLGKTEMKKRMVFKNLDLLFKLQKEGKSGFVMMGHCSNWEYMISLPLWHGAHGDMLYGHVYRPLHNKGVDRFFYELRGKFSSENIADIELFREAVRLKNNKKLYTIGILGDQIPRVEAKYHWMEFLHQDTAVYTGAIKIAQKLGGYVLYADLAKVKRGYYEVEFHVLTEDARTANELELTEQYMKCLEQTLNNNPSYYLWTHNRWKRNRQDFEAFRS